MRICSIDVGGETARDLVATIFTLSYQFALCLMFVLGDPIVTFILRGIFHFKPNKFLGPI